MNKILHPVLCVAGNVHINMKTLIYILLIGTAVVQLQALYGANTTQVEEALSLLQNTKIINSPYRWFWANGHEALAIQSLYQKQVAAMNVLASSKDGKYISVLIAYLDYSQAGSMYGIDDPNVASGGNRAPYSKKAISEYWPAAGAILAIPDCAKYLEAYTMEKRNPANLRIVSFELLKYADKATFERTANALEATSGPKAKAVLKNIESEVLEFDGLKPLREFSFDQ